jgi:hypothetical protein
MAYLRGEPKVWSVLCVPSVAEEDDRRLHRERDLLSACLTSSDTFTAPSGATANTAKCSYSPNGCYQQASQTCGGPYLVLDSESHAGGALADALPGPVTWYAMTYQCGPSDGKLPGLPFRGA